MSKKYQVFISSTYVDLKEERKSIIDTLLLADCIPAGMEAFSAVDDKQFNVIKKVIDLCDYYILIIGNRYGSINEDTQKSYTQMEYEYAESKGIPVLVFVLENNASYPTDNCPHRATKLAIFKQDAMKDRMASIWTDIASLNTKVAVAIMRIQREQPRPGWIRANSITAGALTESDFNISVKPTSKELVKNDPAQFKLALLYDDVPVSDASVSLIAENATFILGHTNDKGIAEIQIRTQHVYSLLITHPEFPAYISYDSIAGNDLLVCFHDKNSWGSIICNSTCYLPGLLGRLNIILDSQKRTYLYAENISLDNKTSQPFYFEVNKQFTLEDSHGSVFVAVVIFIRGTTSVLNYKQLS